MLALHNILNGIWSMDRDYVANYLPVITAYLKGERTPELVKSSSNSDQKEFSERNGISTMVLKNGVFQVSDYGSWSAPEDAPKDSIAIINVNGAITKYDQQCGPSGMATKSELAIRCANNKNIIGVGFKIDSGGGETRAMRLMSDTINEINGRVPTGAFIDDAAYSAAAGIATACNFRMANNNDAGFGSFGTYATIVDYSKYYEALGINILEIYADASTDKNQPFIQALKGNDKLLKELINQVNESFLSMVETNLGDQLKADRKDWATGKTFFAPQAMDMGMINAIGTFDEFINSFYL